LTRQGGQGGFEGIGKRGKKRGKAGKNEREGFSGIKAGGRKFYLAQKRKRPPAHSKIGEPFSFLRTIKAPRMLLSDSLTLGREPFSLCLLRLLKLDGFIYVL
jgi:hypothetical protein